MGKTSKNPEGAQANTAPQQTDRHIATVKRMFVRPDELTDAQRAHLTQEQEYVLYYAHMYNLGSQSVELLGGIGFNQPERTAELIERLLFAAIASDDFDAAGDPELLGEVYNVLELLRGLSGFPVED